MKHSDVKLKDLVDGVDMMQAIDMIEKDARNIIGGHAAWASGRQTYMSVAAQKKIDAINRKFDKLYCGEDDE